MLDAIEPREFDEWLAYRELEPEPMGRVIEILKVGFAALASAFSGVSVEPDYFEPQPEKGSPVVAEDASMSPQQGAAAFGQWAGGA